MQGVTLAYILISVGLVLLAGLMSGVSLIYVDLARQ